MLAHAAILAGLLSLPAGAADVTREVPAKFLGDWCTEYSPGEEEAGESDLRITAHEVSYYQDSSRIIAPATVGNELALIVLLQKDGHVRLVTHELELSGDGGRLMSLRPDGQLHTRARCQPSAEGPPNNSSKKS